MEICRKVTACGLRYTFIISVNETHGVLSGQATLYLHFEAEQMMISA